MNKQSIIHLAKLARDGEDTVEIKHERRASYYTLLGFLNVKTDGQWLVHIYYQCNTNKKVYARTSDNFQGFH